MYKKLSIGIITICVTSFFASIVWIYTGYKDPTNTTLWVRNIYELKEKYANSISSPKILVIAGSNVIFGVSAKMMEDELGVPVVNFGSHAGIGVDYILGRAKRSLKPGDMAIIPLEYEHYWRDGKFGKTGVILNYDKQFLRELPVLEQLDMITPYIKPLMLIRTYLNAQKKEDKYTSNGYTAKNLNSHGDETVNVGNHYEGTGVNHFVDRPKEITWGIKKVIEFINWCNSNGVKILISWPGYVTIENFGDEKSQSYINWLTGLLKQSGAGMLGQTEDYFQDAEMFYDTFYHLNQKGAEIRTNIIINQLIKHPIYTEFKQKP